MKRRTRASGEGELPALLKTLSQCKLDQYLPFSRVGGEVTSAQVEMNRESEALLLAFVVEQHRCFVPEQWLEFPHPDREEFAAAVLFLAGVDWYGYRCELGLVARSVAPAFSRRLSELVSRTGFDLSRFSNQVRRLLEHAEAAP